VVVVVLSNLFRVNITLAALPKQDRTWLTIEYGRAVQRGGEMDHQWSNLLREILADIWHKYGPFAALLIIGAVAYEIRFTRLWEARLADKDKEIERLVKERDRLQEIVLKKRLSSK
jgi:hypothetical protein